jgi:hypothetical protein
MKRIVGFLAVLLLIGLLDSCGGPPSGIGEPSRPPRPRPSHFGISLPYPKSVPPYTGDSLPAVVGAERLIPLRLLIDAKGKVKTVGAESPEYTPFAASSSRFFRGMKFVPGLRNGQRDSMTVRIVLQVGGPGGKLIVRFPVGPGGWVDDGNLYWAAMTVLGYHPACLRRFGSYGYLIDQGTKWRSYNYKLFWVELDSAGDVTSVDLVAATEPAFNEQLRSAINWGEYQPLTIAGRPVASTNFLTVLILPTVDYPTLTLEFDRLNTYSVWDRLRVSMVPDTLGVLAPPIPKREWSTVISDKFLSGMTPDLISGRIRVDSSGSSRIDNITSDFWKARRILSLGSLEKPFFPALDFSGQSRSWDGLVLLQYTSDSTTQIWFDWDRHDDYGGACNLTESN